MRERRADEVASSGNATLEVVGVSLSFGALEVLHDVDLTAAPGGILGLIGPNGSGKTSLLNCINGIYRPNVGTVRLGDFELSDMAAHQIAGLGVGRTFQHVEAPRDMSMLEFVLLGRHIQMSKFGTFASGMGLPAFTGYERQHRTAARAALNRVGLGGLEDRAMGGLPYGLVKRADLARAIAGDPKLLLLDEPVAGLNQAERLELADVISSLDRARMAVCVVEHDMEFVSKVCARLHVLSGGETIASGPKEQVLAQPEIAEAFLGRRADSNL